MRLGCQRLRGISGRGNSISSHLGPRQCVQCVCVCVCKAVRYGAGLDLFWMLYRKWIESRAGGLETWTRCYDTGSGGLTLWMKSCEWVHWVKQVELS